MSLSRRRLAALLLASLGAVLGLALLLGLRSADSRAEAEWWRAHTDEVRVAAAELGASLADAAAAASGGDAAAGPGTLAGRQQAREALAHLARLTGDNPVQQQRLSALRSDFDRGLALLDATPATAARDDAARRRGVALLADARGRLDAFGAEEQRLLAMREGSAAAAGERSHWLLLVLSALAALSFGVAVAAVVAAARNAARRETEQQQAFVDALIESLRADPAAALAHAATRLGRHFGATRCGYAEADGNAETISVAFEYTDGTAAPARGRHTLDDFGTELAGLLRAGQVVAVSDVARDPRTRAAAAAHLALGTRAFVAVPLRRDERLRAILHLSHGAPRAWAAAEVGLLRDAADRTWSVVEQARAEAELARTLEQFRTLADNIPAMCWMADPDGHIFWYNRRWYEYTGTTEAEMRGWGWQQVHDPAVLPAVNEGWRAALASGTLFEMTFPLRGADGAFRPFLTRVYPERDRQGRVCRWLGVNTDVSEAQARETALRRSEAALQARTAEIETLITSAPLGVCFLDREYRYLRINATLAAINGVPIDAHIGRTIADILPANALAVEPVIDRVFTTGEAVAEFEVTGTTPREPNVKRHWITGFYPVRDAEGAIASVGCWVVEITRRKRMEAALAESEGRLQAIFDTVNVGIVFAEAPSGRIVFGNAAMERIFRHPVHYASRTDDYGPEWESYDADGRRIHSDEYPLARVLASGEPAHGEYHYQCGDGVRRWISIAGSPVRGEGGRLNAVVVVCADIDALKQAQAVLARDAAELGQLVAERTRELADAQARLAHAQRLEALGQLAGGIAHDFNNVLQAVLGGARLIETRPTDADRVRRLAAMTAEAAERGAGVTRRLLAFSRRADLRAEPIDPDSLLRSLSEVLAHTLGGGVAVGVDVAVGTPPLFADRGQLETALINLGTNARDAMPDGGTVAIAAVAARIDGHRTLGLAPGDYVVLSVTDQGQGMAPDVLARASEPFFTTKPQGRGTGLGLATARGFAEQSGGALEIVSTAGRGTTVRLWLPQAPGQPIPAAREVAAVGPAGARVLLVDDEALVRAITAEQLAAAGYEVQAVASGRDALAVLETRVIDLLITDLSMPGMDGLAVIREAQRRQPSLPSILLTGYATDAAELAVGGATTGRFTLLRKPVTGRLLAERAAMLLDNVAARP